MSTACEDVLALAIEAFTETFGDVNGDMVYGFAPGRVNLIGEHTDYNDGFVLPMALPLVTVVIGRRNNTQTSRIVTTCETIDDQKDITFELGSICRGSPKWANYVKGVIFNFHRPVREGFDAIIASSVPLGGGLSSSASLEVAVYSFLEALTGTNEADLSRKALACQKAEHDFAEVPCGIMDQFISTMAKEGHALLIDCASLEATPVPLDDPNVKIVIVNSNVRHELTGSEYKTRRDECESVASHLGVKSLRFATRDNLNGVRAKLSTEEAKRACHVISEIERTRRGAELLKSKDYQMFGKFMIDSHNSLRKDFEVSCKELDELVNIALSVDGVYGSRMTGGGFGGCTVSLVKTDAVENLTDKIMKNYSGNATLFVCSAGGGARFGKLQDIPLKLWSDSQLFPVHL